MLAVELLCSCRSFDFRKPYRPGAAGSAVYHVVRKYANEIGPDVRDTWTTPQIEGVAEAILSGEVLAARRIRRRRTEVAAAQAPSSEGATSHPPHQNPKLESYALKFWE